MVWAAGTNDSELQAGAPQIGFQTPPSNHPLFQVARQIWRRRGKLKRFGIDVEVDPFARGIELVHYKRSRSRPWRVAKDRRKLVALVTYAEDTGRFRVSGADVAAADVLPSVFALAHDFRERRRRRRKEGSFFERLFAWV